MEHYMGIDVSLEESSIVDASGAFVREVKIASEQEALVRYWNVCHPHWTRDRPYRNGCMPGLWPPDAMRFCSRHGT